MEKYAKQYYASSVTTNICAKNLHKNTRKEIKDNDHYWGGREGDMIREIYSDLQIHLYFFFFWLRKKVTLSTKYMGICYSIPTSFVYICNDL